MTDDGLQYDNSNVLGKHTCHMGPAKALKALAEIPTDKRSNEITQTTRGLLLAHHVFKMSHDLTKVAKPGWLNFKYLMYQTDVLEVARILLDLGYKDPRLQEAVDFVLSKQSTEGKIGGKQGQTKQMDNAQFVASVEKLLR